MTYNCEIWYVYYMDLGETIHAIKILVQILTAHWKNGTSRTNWKNIKVYLVTYLFNVHPISINHMFKACYTLLNSFTKSFSVKWRNMTCYASFNSGTVCMFSVFTWSSRNFHNQKSQELLFGERGGYAIEKRLEIIKKFVFKVSPKQCSHFLCIVRLCTIIHGPAVSLM